MAAATTTDQFLELLRKSGLVESNRLDALVKTLSPDVRKQPRLLAELLIRQGLLTPFQAGQLLAGKWRGFLIASGKYKLLQLLGVGGMGRVYLCEHLRMRRLVALKVLPEEQTKEASAVERFNREAQAAAALNHPNIVRAHDIDQDGTMHFLVMEYVDGASLQDIVKKHGPFEVNRACHYISQSAIGLQHAHEAGWVHRDIKPGNLLLDRNGVVKILDMGLARFFHTPDNEKLTQNLDNKAVLGTADYLAPEQAVNSSEVDIRADIYSLGATLYFLLTGKAPFEDGSVAQKLLAHQSQEPVAVTTLRPDVPKPLEAVLKKMMAKKPVHRYQTPQAVVDALQPWTDIPIEMPADEEMSRLCPALLNYAATPSGSMAPLSGNLGPVSARIRKPPAGTRSSSYILRQGAGLELSRLAKQRPALLLGACIGVVLSFCVLILAITQPWNRRPSIGPIVVEQPAQTPAPPPPTKTTWTPTPVRPDRPASQTLFVSRTPQPSVTGRNPVYSSLADAMSHVGPGVRVVVLDELVEHNLVLDNPEQHRGVVIEAGSPQSVTWQPAPDSGTSPAIEIRGVPNVKLKGFTVRGGARTASLIRVQGSCPGLRLDDLRLIDFPGTAVEFTGTDPAADDPMVLQKLRFVTVHDYFVPTRDKIGDVRTAAITIGVARGPLPGGPSIVVNECRFEGLFQSAVEITGPIAAEFYRNRFMTLRDDERPNAVQSCEAFLWRPGPVAGAPRLHLASNTVARFTTFIRLAQVPPGGTGSIDMRSNLMVGGTMWATGPGKPDDKSAMSAFNATANVARPRTCTLGYDIPRKYVDFKNFSYSLDDSFLRYPKSAPGDNKPHELSTAGAGGEPAGYPPFE